MGIDIMQFWCDMDVSGYCGLVGRLVLVLSGFPGKIYDSEYLIIDELQVPI
jgi:hypothetical protein